jgi:hypothetical protein
MEGMKDGEGQSIPPPKKLTLAVMLERDAAQVLAVPTAVHRRRKWLRLKIQ